MSVKKSMATEMELISGLPVAVYGCDADGYIEFYNTAAITLWGTEPVKGKDRWCGSFKMYTIDGKPIQPGNSPMAKALKEKPFIKTAMCIERPDGERRYVIPNPQLRFKPDGKILGAINTLIDITAQIEEQKKLAESAKQFTSLANSIPNLAWMAHPDGSIYWYNQNWYAYTGTTIDEMQGWGWKSVHDPAHLPTVLENWQKSIDKGEPFEMVFPLKGADNVYRSFLTRIFPVHNELGEVMHWFGTNTDINEQKRYSEILEATLLESESQKEAILKFAPDAVVSIDAQGCVLSWNPEAEKIFGWHEEEVLGKTLTETIIPNRYADKHNSGMKNYLNTGEGPVINKLIEVSAVKKNKKEFPIELKISATKINGQDIFIGFIRDITQRKKAEETIRHKTNQLIEAQQLAHIGSWEWDVPTDKIDWSDELYRIYGLLPQEFEANYENYIQQVHPEDREYVNGIVQQAFVDHQPFSFHHRIVHRDGTERILSATGKVFTDQLGQTVKMTGTAQDVTDQKRKEAELKESEERFFKIFDNNPVPLSLAEIKTNKITYVNNLFCSAFGYGKD
ncbi:MAG: PAS domain S-box protein, partial [Pricia sp.]|nr:PAS domain S-box protein [Pricia sp.]